MSLIVLASSLERSEETDNLVVVDGPYFLDVINAWESGGAASLSCINYIQEVRAIDHDEIVSFLW